MSCGLMPGRSDPEVVVPLCYFPPSWFSVQYLQHNRSLWFRFCRFPISFYPLRPREPADERHLRFARRTAHDVEADSRGFVELANVANAGPDAGNGGGSP